MSEIDKAFRAVLREEVRAAVRAALDDAVERGALPASAATPSGNDRAAFTYAELQQRWKRSRSYFCQARREGLIPVVMFGTRPLVTRETVERLEREGIPRLGSSRKKPPAPAAAAE